MKLLYLDEYLSYLIYEMNSDLRFTCQQLEENEVYRIDNNKLLCIRMKVRLFLTWSNTKVYGFYKNQMVCIPPNIGTLIKSITGSRCVLLFGEGNVSVCDKLFSDSLFAKGEEPTQTISFFPLRSL